MGILTIKIIIMQDPPATLFKSNINRCLKTINMKTILKIIMLGVLVDSIGSIMFSLSLVYDFYGDTEVAIIGISLAAIGTLLVYRPIETYRHIREFLRGFKHADIVFF